MPRAWARGGSWLRVGLGVTVMSAVIIGGAAETSGGATCRVWERVEIELGARGPVERAYQDVEVWVELRGPGFERRCYGFWDGGRTWRVRVMATKPGTWTWRSGSRPEVAGLSGREGAFEAKAWTEEEKRENRCRRGMIRASRNGHAFEFDDGTPFFLVGDTWWATPTSRFRWDDDDRPRPMGPEAGFKDYVRYRKGQGFNCIAMIAAFPHWHNDGKPARLNAPDGTVIRAAWPQAGTRSAKSMTDGAGRRPFAFPGKVPGFEDVVPDLDRIVPEYFQEMDRKVDWLNAQGFVPFIEVARRDIGQVWKKHHRWPDSYVRYVQYVWSRYQANVCLFSPIHFDTPAKSIPASEWNRAANAVIERYGPPPFGTLCGTNANPSSLRNYGHVDKARWLGFHQIGNRRTHDCYGYLEEIWRARPPVPGINGEPYYDGMEDAEGGTAKAALYCRSAMYGSVLSGGLGGHIYGAGGWKGGLWSGEVEKASKYPIWEVIGWPSAGQMQHLAAFVLSEGRRYQDLIPSTALLTPHRSGKSKGLTGWAYCARTAERDLFVVYFERDCPRATLSGLRPKARYRAQWFDPRAGKWLGRSTVVADASGKARLPSFPGAKARPATDWGLKLTTTGRVP